MYSFGAPLNNAPSDGTMCLIKNLATYPKTPYSGPGSENSKIANLPTSFFSTRCISHNATDRSSAGTFRMPKAMVIPSKVLSPNLLRSRESPISSEMNWSNMRSASFSLPTPIIFWEGSTPIISTEFSNPFFSIALVISCPNKIATSAVPVAKSKMFFFPSSRASPSMNNVASITSFTMTRLQDVSMFSANTLLIMSYRGAMLLNMDPVPKSVGGVLTFFKCFM
mmetsp:Transcript_41681/g.61190  ORF Transcript_41681/g.61190 Transcript_41681/m.61190 type:complete len:224 (-) Transcript_41681:206-877(-)